MCAGPGLKAEPVQIDNSGRILLGLDWRSDNTGVYVEDHGKITKIPNAPHNPVMSMSDSGWIATSSMTIHRYRIDESGAISDEGTLPMTGTAYGINDRGDVAGQELVSNSGARDLETRNFLYRDGEQESYTDWWSAVIPSPIAINNHGDVLQNFDKTAYIYRNGVSQALEPPHGARDTFASDLNDSGIIIGQSYGEATNFGWKYEDGTYTGLGTLGESGLTQPHVINNLGMIGGVWEGIQRINEEGEYVGSNQRLAFLYEDGVMHDLNALIPPESTWTLDYVIDMNDAGQILVEGVQGVEWWERKRRYYLLDPVSESLPVPEPTTLAILIAGMAGGVMRWWKTRG